MDSKLYNALIADNIDVLKKMEHNLCIGKQQTPTNNTVLLVACQYGSITCAKEILSVHESLLLKVNLRGETALHLAARQGHYDVVAELINAAKTSHLQPNYLEYISYTVPQILIRTASLDHETALHAAVRYNHENVVKLLVTEDPSFSHLQNRHNETPLYLATIRRYTDIIRIILDNCEALAFGGPEGRTALHAAVLDNGGHECVKLLLEKNKDLTKVTDNYGWTALHYVAFNNLKTIVKYLVDADKSVGYQADNEYKRTALRVAAYEGSVAVMKELVEYYPDLLEVVDGSYRNIFHIAVEQDKKNVIRYILSLGGKSSNNLLIQRDSDGNTPLHLIAKLGCYVPELMDLTLRAPDWKVDWEVLDCTNLTPLDVLHVGQETDWLTPDKVKIRNDLIEANVQRHWYLWHTLKEPHADWSIKVNRRLAKVEEEQNIGDRKELEPHMIVAALIATVALTAGFAMPGGFDGNQGPTQGSPILLRKTAFETFMITDTIALLFSFSSLFIYFMTTLSSDARRVGYLLFSCVLLNIFSIIAIMMAFISGTYAVLAHSSALAVCVCVISSFFFLLIPYLFIKVAKDQSG